LLGFKPHWALFWKFFQVKPQPNKDFPRVVGGARIQMREKANEQYFDYNLIDSNQDWKYKWLYMNNHLRTLLKPSMYVPKHNSC
jgi:hypothetical protein